MNTKSVKPLNVFAAITMLMLAAAVANAQTTFSNALVSLSPGPVAYWPLQENTQPPAPYVETNLGSLGKVGNAYYASTNVIGQYQLGELINGGFTFNGINGDSGSFGVDFNGNISQSFMAVPTTDSRVSLPAGGPFTVEAWIYPCVQAQKCSIISQTGPVTVGGLNQSTNSAGWSLNINYMPRWGTNSANLGNLLGFSFHVFNGNGFQGNADGAEADAANFFNSNFWYHVVGVFDGTNCTLYVDGTNDTVYQQPINGSFTPDTWDPLMFGVSHAVDSSGGNSTIPTAYTGGMLDVAIYTNALNFQQVSNDYAYGTQNGVSGSYTNWVMTQNKPYMFWQLSAPQYTVPATNTYPVASNYGTITDPNINGLYQPGTMPGVAGPSYSGMGSFTNAVAINGLNSAVMAWTNNNSLSSPLNVTNHSETLLCWFKGNPADAEERFQTLVSRGNNGWRLAMDQIGHIHWTFAAGSDLTNVIGSYNDGNWHFVAGVYNNTGTLGPGGFGWTATNYLYLDGRLDNSALVTNNETAALTNLSIFLGGDPSFTVTNLGLYDPPFNFNTQERYFAGSIAHVAYFTNALTAAQIQNLYTNAVPTQAPYIIGQPVTGRTITGAPANFSFIFFGVLANGSPTLAYQWYYNTTSNYAGATALSDSTAGGTKNLGSQTFQVAVSNLVNSDAGFYYVVITNNFGSVTSSLASLVVDSSPIVTAQTPANSFSMFTNQTELLSVTATGETPLAYQWFTNGVADTTAGTTPTYNAVGLQTANSETYYCQVTNINGLTNSATVTETLLNLPPSLLNSGYSSNVLAFGATAYWPMHEHETQPLLGVGNIETNYGTWGTIGNGYYEDWASPGFVYHRSPSAIAGDTNPSTTFYSGQGSDGIVVPHYNSVTTIGTNQQPFCLEAWIKPFSDNSGGVGSYMVIMGQGVGSSYNNGANKAGFALQYGGSPSTFSLVVQNGSAGNDFEQKTAALYPPGTWYHIVCFWSGTSETYYVNGTTAPLQTPNSFATPQVLNPDFVSPFTIGGGRWGTGGLAQPFNGSIDEVAVYTNITTAPQAQALAARDYAAGTTVSSNYFQTIMSNQPALYYRMDAPGYVQPPSSAMTCILTNYGAVAQNGVYVPSSVPGSAFGPNINGAIASGLMDTNAMQGNGVMSFADAGFNSLWTPVTTNAFSFTIWCKGEPIDARSFGNQMLTENDSTLRGSINAAGQFQMHAGNSDITPPNNGNDGNWHQLVVTAQPGLTNNASNNGIFDGVFTNTVYVDGVLAIQGVNAGTNNPFSNANGVETLIGDEWGDTNPVTQGNGARSFIGALCEAAIFEGTVLTPSQVSALYNSGGMAPKIILSPVSGTATASLPYTLSVTASGALPLYYQWYTNNVAIGGSATNVTGEITNGVSTAVLTINPVEPLNAGTYFAVVSNGYGMATSAIATLTIVTSPVITNYTPFTYTTPFALYAGVNPIFSVSGFGAVPLGYYWFTNGTQDASIANTSSTYTNYNVQTAFTNYCVVSNSFGVVTSILWAATITPDPTAPYPQWVLSNSPAAYWRLNEADQNSGNGPDNGEIGADYAGGNNGVYTNVTLGNPGYSPTLDPSDTSVNVGFLSANNADLCAINGPDFTTANGNNAEFAVSAWVNPTSPENGNAGIVAKGLFNQEEYNLDCGGANNGFRFEVRQAGAQNVTLSSAVALQGITNLNQWYQLVGVVDQANSLVSLYVNGKLAGTTIITNNTGLFNSAATPLSIGSRSSVNPSYVFGGDDQQFYGYINDVAIYRHTLSSNQVIDSYARAVPVSPYLYSSALGATNFSSAAGVLTISTNPVLIAGSAGITNWWTLLNSGNAVSNVLTVITNGTLLNASLVVSNVPVSWNGDQLELTASNAYGGTNYIVNLVVSSKPVIVVDIPPALATIAGRYYTYSPTLIGSPPLNFQWYSNSVALSGQTNPTFSFTASGSGTNGYSYIVNNTFGSVTSIVSLVTVYHSYQALILSNGPAAYWPLDEGPDDTNGDDGVYALDLAGNNTAMYTNAVIGVPGLPGDPFTVAQFGTFATSYSYAKEVSATANPDMGQLAVGNGNNGEFSVECWVNGPPGQALNSRIVDCGYFFHEEWALDLGTTTPSSAFRFTIRGASEQEYDARATLQADNNWHYLVGVCDGANGQLVLYIDGQVAATNNFDTGFGPGVGIDERPEPIAIGNGDTSSSEGGTYTAQWTGKISDVAVYTNVLTAAQVLAHYQSVTTGIYPVPVVTNQLPVPGENQFTLYAGVSPTYQAIASGVAPLAYQWYSNGVAVANATNTTFTINKVQNGAYTNYCIITNAEGSGTSIVWNASVVAGPSSLFPATVLSNNPIAYWRLNESSGTLANDYAGGANGTYGSSTANGQPGIPYGQGELGVTMNNTASGVSAGCVSSAGVILNTNTVTFLCWINPSTLIETNPSGLLFTRNGNNVAGDQIGGANDLDYTWSNNPATYNYSSGLQVPANKWTLVALTTTPTNTILYVINTNGFNSATNPVANLTQSFENGVSIGADPLATNRIFQGEIDEAAIFNYTLSSAQLQQLFSAATNSAVVINTTPTNIVFSVSGNKMTLSWPADHTGWLLQAQTNTVKVGISTNWANVSGSTGTNVVVVPVNLTSGCVFYRLVYP